MHLNKSLALFGSCMLGFSCALAGTMGPINTPVPYGFVMALQGGYAKMSTSRSQTYIGNDSDSFIYLSNQNGRNTGFIGGFLGFEHPLSFDGLSAQFGLGYDYFGRLNSQGVHTVGNDPETSTVYQYNYKYQTQQVLATGKLFTTVHQWLHPYVAAGLGAAFNRLGDYNASTLETGTINLTPTFSNHNSSAFAYSLSAGIDASVNQNIRVGLGYRYNSFGKAHFGDGTVHFNNELYPVPFSLSQSNLHAQQVIAQVSYLI